MTFAPMVDVAKDARWGRVSEGAGEDTLVASAYGAAKVRGFQGRDLSAPDSMAACVKHFAAYGAAEAGRDYNRVDMSPQRLYEEYLPSFRACVEAGAKAVMPAFNDINGVPCTVNRWLLRDVLRGDLGFDGVTVSDSNAIAECVEHGLSENRAQAAKDAIEAGVDIDMSSDVYIKELAALVERGEVSMDVLDKAVGEVLRLRYELGLFENPYQSNPERAAKDILRPEDRALAREAAEKSIVLLKNDGVLPLKQGVCIGVWGELASSRSDMLGAWSVGADGEQCVSLTDALTARKADFVLLDGEDPAAQAANCDVILAAVGETKELSGEAASRADIGLPDGQDQVLAQLSDTGKPVVTVVFSGRPLAMPLAAERSRAVVQAWHLGVEAGNAIAGVLFGDVNPSGKLTVTFPYTSGQCPMYYAHINTGRPGGKSKFTSKYLDTPLEPLVDFTKIHLESGEERAVAFVIPQKKLGYYDTEMNFVAEPGEFDLFAGGNSRDCLSAQFVL